MSPEDRRVFAAAVALRFASMLGEDVGDQDDELERFLEDDD